MNIVDRVLNDKQGKQIKVLQLPENADTVTDPATGKVYRRKKKDGEFISEDFFETDEPATMRSLTIPQMPDKPNA